MNCTASSAAAGLTIASSEPARNTVECNTPSKSGCTPSSGGIKGKTAAPSGISSSSFSTISASGLRRNDAQLVAVFHSRGEIFKIPNILVVEVNIDKPAHLTTVEEPLRNARK